MFEDAVKILTSLKFDKRFLIKYYLLHLTWADKKHLKTVLQV